MRLVNHNNRSIPKIHPIPKNHFSSFQSSPRWINLSLSNSYETTVSSHLEFAARRFYHFPAKLSEAPPIFIHRNRLMQNTRSSCSWFYPKRSCSFLLPTYVEHSFLSLDSTPENRSWSRSSTKHPLLVKRMKNLVTKKGGRRNERMAKTRRNVTGSEDRAWNHFRCENRYAGASMARL